MTALVRDLVQHVLAKHESDMRRATELIETDGEQLSFLLSVVASEIGALRATLAGAYSAFDRLTEQQQLLATLSLLLVAFGYTTADLTTAENLREVRAAILAMQ